MKIAWPSLAWLAAGNASARQYSMARESCQCGLAASVIIASMAIYRKRGESGGYVGGGVAAVRYGVPAAFSSCCGSAAMALRRQYVRDSLQSSWLSLAGKRQ